MLRDDILDIAKPLVWTAQFVQLFNNAGFKNVQLKQKAFPNEYLQEIHTTEYSSGWQFMDHIYESWSSLPWHIFEKYCKYSIGDILYVKEPWKRAMYDPFGGGYALTDTYLYKADEDKYDASKMLTDDTWFSASTMPKEASRIFLQVNNIRLAHVQDVITANFFINMWALKDPLTACKDYLYYPEDTSIDFLLDSHAHAKKNSCLVLHDYRNLWNAKIKKSDYGVYDWDANPWIWVVECEKFDIT